LASRTFIERNDKARQEKVYKTNKLKGDYSKQVASKWRMINERTAAIEETASSSYIMQTTRFDDVKMGLRQQLFDNCDFESD
jgi:hypothetical protein